MAFILAWSITPGYGPYPNRVEALRVSDGTVVWSFRDPDLAGARSILADAGGVLVIGWNGLFVLDARSGKLVRRTKERWDTSSFPTSLLADRGRIYYSLASGKVVALDRTNGKMMWERSWNESIRALALHRECLIAPIGNGPEVLALSSADGSIIWPRRLPSYTQPGGRVLPAAVIAPPSACGTSVVVPTAYGAAWKIAKASTIALDLNSGNELWRADMPPGLTSTVALDGHRAVVSSSDGDVTCLILGTGKRIWRTKPLQQPGGGTADSYCLTPVIAGAVVLVACGTGDLYGLCAKTGRTLWQLSVGGSLSLTSDRVVVAGQHVIVTQGPKILAYRRP